MAAPSFKPIAVNDDVTAAFLNNQTGVLDRSTGDVDVASSTTETTVYSFSVLGGTLLTSRSLRVELGGDLISFAGGGTQTTFRIKYGATTLASNVLPYLGANIRRNWEIGIRLQGDGATNAQVVTATLNWGAPDGNGTGSICFYGTAVEDSTATKTLSFTAQHNASSSSLSFRKFRGTLEFL